MKYFRLSFITALTLLGFLNPSLGEVGHSLCSKILSGDQSSLATSSKSFPRSEIAIYKEFVALVMNEVRSNLSNPKALEMKIFEAILASHNPIDPMEILPTILRTPGFARENPTLASSHLLSLLQVKRPLGPILSNLKSQSWGHIQSWVEDELQQLVTLEQRAQVTQVETSQDFLDRPDIHGEIRLHGLFRNQKWEEALALLRDPKTVAKYINTRNRDRKTPLDIFEETIERIPGIPTITSAAIIQILQSKNAKSGWDMARVDEDLLRSVAYNNIEFVSKLLDLGADPNCKTLGRLRPPNDPFSQGNRPLHIAAYMREPAMISLLVESGSDVNGRNDEHRKTSLHWAAQQGNTPAIQLLIQLGADPNLSDIDDNTPAHLAAYSNQPQSLSALIEGGADLEFYNDLEQRPIDVFLGKLFLHWDEDVAKIAAREFKSVKLNLNSIQRSGFTPSTYNFFLSVEAFRFLAEAGADIEAPDRTGKTIYDYINIKAKLDYMRSEFKHQFYVIIAEYFAAKGQSPESRGLFINKDTGLYFYEKPK